MKTRARPAGLACRRLEVIDLDPTMRAQALVSDSLQADFVTFNRSSLQIRLAAPWRILVPA